MNFTWKKNVSENNLPVTNINVINLLTKLEPLINKTAFPKIEGMFLQVASFPHYLIGVSNGKTDLNTVYCGCIVYRAVHRN